MSDTATFLGSDLVTKGAWPGVYGADGYYVVGSPTNYPAYATVTLFNTSEYDGWTVISPQSLQTPADHTVRTSDTHYSDGSPFDVQIIGTDYSYQLAYYFFDGDNSSRTQTVEIRDATRAILLDTQSLSGGYSNPVYLKWQCSGYVVVRSIPTGGSFGNATWNGLFFDAGVSIAAPTQPCLFVVT